MEKKLAGRLLKMDLLLTKYMKAHITYEGLTRVETFNFPEKAMREAILNALIHKDYSSSNPVQISVYEDWLMIYNNGDLPLGWTTETLKIKHTSEPYNPDIAKVFFRAGYIETWGRGTVNIVEYCKQAGVPEPVFESKWGGLAVIFIKKEGMRPWERGDEVSDKDVTKTDEKLGEKLGENQRKIINLMKEDPYVSIPKMADKIGISTTAVENNIKKLKMRNIIKRIGPDKGGYWQVLDK